MPKPKFIEIKGNLGTTIKRFPKDRKKALLLSIQKWEAIVDALQGGRNIVNDGGRSTYGLCQMYFDNGCNGCPVKEHTGKSYCRGTPYYTYSVETEFTGGTLETAQQELDFLRSLQHKEDQ